MGGASSAHGSMGKQDTILIWMSEKRNHSEDMVYMGIILNVSWGSGVVGRGVSLAQYSECWRAFVNTVMNRLMQ